MERCRQNTVAWRNTTTTRQEENIDAVIGGREATGGGKPLCCQLPALAFGGLTVVVSPLIAPMNDSVDGVRENGIPAATIDSSLERGEQKISERVILEGRIRILYVSPERARAAVRRLPRPEPQGEGEVPPAHRCCAPPGLRRQRRYGRKFLDAIDSRRAGAGSGPERRSG